MEMTKENMRQWAKNWEEINEIQRRAVAREPRRPPGECLEEMLGLLAVAEELSGIDPLTAPDPIRDREKARVVEAWMKLHEHWRHSR